MVRPKWAASEFQQEAHVLRAIKSYSLRTRFGLDQSQGPGLQRGLML